MLAAMCNLYSIMSNPDAIRAFAEAMLDTSGNLQPLPAVFPDYVAPVVRNLGAARELTTMRWEHPGPTKFGGLPVTNVRNPASPHSAGLVEPRIPPASCRSPPSANGEDTKPRKTPTGSRSARQPLAFAGIGRPWTGMRGTKANPVEGEHRLFSFLTTEPNAVVAPIHEKAMPVILTTPAEVDAWLTLPTAEACAAAAAWRTGCSASSRGAPARIRPPQPRCSEPSRGIAPSDRARLGLLAGRAREHAGASIDAAANAVLKGAGGFVADLLASRSSGVSPRASWSRAIVIRQRSRYSIGAQPSTSEKRAENADRDMPASRPSAATVQPARISACIAQRHAG